MSAHPAVTQLPIMLLTTMVLVQEAQDQDSALIFTSCYVANDTTRFTLAEQIPGYQRKAECFMLSTQSMSTSMSVTRGNNFLLLVSPTLSLSVLVILPYALLSQID